MLRHKWTLEKERLLGYKYRKRIKLRKLLRQVFKDNGRISDLDKITSSHGKDGKWIRPLKCKQI